MLTPSARAASASAQSLSTAAASAEGPSPTGHVASSVRALNVSDSSVIDVGYASVIGAEIPVWDIRTKFGATDMLVRSLEQGRDLAAALGNNTCALLRGHGAVVVGASIERAVLTAIYLQVNAKVLLQALQLGPPEALSAEEIARSSETQFSPLALDRSWEYFCQRAGVDPG